MEQPLLLISFRITKPTSSLRLIVIVYIFFQQVDDFPAALKRQMQMRQGASVDSAQAPPKIGSSGLREPILERYRQQESSATTRLAFVEHLPTSSKIKIRFFISFVVCSTYFYRYQTN